jgi:hypothetical protein
MSLPTRTEIGRTPPHEPEFNSSPFIGSLIQGGLVLFYFFLFFLAMGIVDSNIVVLFLLVICSPLILGAISYTSCSSATQKWQCVAAAIVAALPFGVLALIALLIPMLYGYINWPPILALGGSSLATFVVSNFAGRKSMMKRRVVDGQCPTCGYSTEGLPGDVCPECGEVVESTIGRARNENT